MAVGRGEVGNGDNLFARKFHDWELVNIGSPFEKLYSSRVIRGLRHDNLE